MLCRLYSRSVYLVAIPFMLTVLMSIIMAVYFEKQLPKIFDVRSWQNFFFSVDKWSLAEQKLEALSMLMTLHALQCLCCFPFPHITKIMYGYIFGFWQGLVISFLWENSMVMIYLFTFAHCAHMQNSLFLSSLVTYLQIWRNGKLLFLFMLALQTSSIPFVTKASLVMYDVVTPVEFLTSSMIASLIMCMKDTLFGEYISHSKYSTSKLWLYSIFLCFDTLLPLMLTGLIMAEILRFTARGIATNALQDLANENEELLGHGNDEDALQNTEPMCSTHGSACTEINCVHITDAQNPPDPKSCACEDIELASVSARTPPIPPPRRVVPVLAAISTVSPRTAPDRESCTREEIGACADIELASVSSRTPPIPPPRRVVPVLAAISTVSPRTAPDRESCTREEIGACADIELASVSSRTPPIPPPRRVVPVRAATLAAVAE